MIRAELDVVIARPMDEVFGRLIALSDYARWMPKRGLFIRSLQTSAGPVGMGTTYDDQGWMGTFRGQVVECQTPTRVVFQEQLRWLGVPVMEARPAYDLTDTPTGTQIQHTAEGRLFGVFRLMAPVVAWLAHGERARTVKALKDSLERGCGGSALAPEARNIALEKK